MLLVISFSSLIVTLIRWFVTVNMSFDVDDNFSDWLRETVHVFAQEVFWHTDQQQAILLGYLQSVCHGKVSPNS